jgi:hypothetical protein
MLNTSVRKAISDFVTELKKDKADFAFMRTHANTVTAKDPEIMIDSGASNTLTGASKDHPGTIVGSVGTATEGGDLDLLLETKEIPFPRSLWKNEGTVSARNGYWQDADLSTRVQDDTDLGQHGRDIH